ncbi:universal stress protein UspA-like protein [Belliella baltica DSM 15883]|uniref:Universal stress protein UspA-like protein n=1 Tax=Belliella baltica (strain DSM 15883 / CIP 108006 / LMG 21964 / BA134) TaxID=866536 RepID=I3Z9W4_BELBD|nr:universal stress protein [Belliella baltica]AFL86032.1 universal stress protein UspA-like protein [Belliella baltica DSM 15883]
MKRIIVPIDFSSYSENAFLSAMKIASKGNSSITCVNVVASTLNWTILTDKEKSKHQDILDLEAESKDKLKAFILEHKSPGIPIEGVVNVGIPNEEIISLSEKHAANLIVIGAYGKGHIEGKFIGSTLQKVMRNSNCPVLAVKKLLNGNDLRKMAFASLFNEESKPAFTRMKPLIKQLRCAVHFLFVNTPEKFVTSKESEHKMQKYAIGQEELIIHKHIYNHHEAENGIVEFATRNNIGFIAMASNKRKSANTYMIGATETVLFKSDIPVLSVKFE